MIFVVTGLMVVGTLLFLPLIWIRKSRYVLVWAGVAASLALSGMIMSVGFYLSWSDNEEECNKDSLCWIETEEVRQEYLCHGDPLGLNSAKCNEGKREVLKARIRK